jgi:hypothetical protein
MQHLIKYKKQAKSRSDLLSLLSEACELEHGLACSYLFAAFSIKQSTEEGISPAQLHNVRKWAAQIFIVASQEMLHLSQVWNLLKAIGGTPYYFRPNFPQNSKYYSLNIPIVLEPFGIDAMKRFIMYELPSHLNEKDYLATNFNSASVYDYKTVGELYAIIRDGFQSLAEEDLFIVDPDLQIGSDTIDFPEIIKVTDRTSAIAAIDVITEQGEGTSSDRLDCHYGIFKNIEKELKELLEEDPFFRPSRDVTDNPQAYSKINYDAPNGNLITNEITRSYADLFDDIYNLMLRVLQFVFTNTQKDFKANKLMAAYAIQLMVRVIKPLGEALTMMPQHPDAYSKRSGPCFGMVRHVSYPDNLNVSKILTREKHAELIAICKSLAGKTKPVIPQLQGVTANLISLQQMLID